MSSALIKYIIYLCKGVNCYELLVQVFKFRDTLNNISQMHLLLDVKSYQKINDMSDFFASAT